MTRKYQATFLVNDRPDIAALCDADGVHVGPDDLSVADEKKIIGNKIIGRSSHTMDQAMVALKEPISYVAVGPVFGTDCKKVPDDMVGPNLVAEVLGKTHLPVVAIGGITTGKMAPVIQTGVKCVGVIRHIMGTENVCSAAERYIESFNKSF